jgi:hypothetical protein
LPPKVPVSVDDLVRIDGGLARIDEQLAKPQPDVADIVENTGWLKQYLDKLRSVSPDFAKGFEAALGASAAGLVILLIGKLTGALGDLLDFLRLVLG